MTSRSIVLPPLLAAIGRKETRHQLALCGFSSVADTYTVVWMIDLMQRLEEPTSARLTCSMPVQHDPALAQPGGPREVQPCVTAAFSVQFGLQEHMRTETVIMQHDHGQHLHYVEFNELAPLIQAQEHGDVTVTLHLLGLSPLLGPSQELSDTACLVPWRSAAGRDFQVFYGGAFTDCAVRTSDGNSIACHRVILSSASRVFEKTFSTGMKEAAQQEVSIGDADPTAVRLLLQHSYGYPKLNVALLLLLPLLELAQRYDMASLRDAASGWLCTHNLSAGALAALLPQARALGLAEMHEALAERMAPHVDVCADGGLLCGWQLEDVALLLDKAGGSFAAFKAAMSWAQLAQETAVVAHKEESGSVIGSCGFDPVAAWARLLPLVRFDGAFSMKELAAARAMAGAGGIAGLHERLLEAWEAIMQLSA